MKKRSHIYAILIFLLLVGCAGSQTKKQQYLSARLSLAPVYLYKGPVSFQGNYSEQSSGRNFILYLLKKYSPTGFQIVDRLSHLPRSYSNKGRTFSFVPKIDFMVWCRGSSKKEGADSVNTIVHEANHFLAAYFVHHIIKERKLDPYALFSVAYKNGSRVVDHRVPYAYYIGGKKFMIVSRTSTFPSRKIKKYFPARFLRDKRFSFRYRTYIDPSQSSQSTQVDGIYGLLDEFNCYYHGTKAVYDLWPFYRDNPPLLTNIFSYFQRFYGTAFAYGEFKLFILLYLHTAQKEYPAIYKAIISNRAFVRTFLLVDTNFKQLFRNFNERKKNIYGWLRQQGYMVDDRGRSLFIKKRPSEYGISLGSAKGIGTMLDILEAYQKELQKPLYRKMMRVLRNVP